MKVKILSVLLSVTLLFLAVIPVSAAESPYINILDYATPNGDGDLRADITPDNNTIIFEPGFNLSLRDIYITCSLTYNEVTAVYFVAGNVETQLNLTRLASGVYRITGDTPSYQATRFSLRFECNRSLGVTFISFESAVIATSNFIETGTCSINSRYAVATINFNASDTINGRSFSGATDPEDTFLTLDAKVDDWKLYDRLNIILRLRCAAVNTVSVYQGADVIDCTYNIISDGAWFINEFYISVSIDCSNVNRRATDAPTVHIEASTAPEVTNSVDVVSMSGDLNGLSVTPIVFWFQKLNLIVDQRLDVITSQLHDIREYLKGDTAASDSFNDQVQTEIDQLDQAVDVMDSVSRPNINSIDVSMDQFVSGADLAVLTAPVGVFFEQDLFKTILIMSILLATVSFVLFGKR